jgi:hypothetical protein
MEPSTTHTAREDEHPGVSSLSQAALVFALVGCGLLGVLAPDMTWLDAGELAAASWEMGIAHPPGFPLFVMAHKSIMLLVPLGDIAFRGNVASALMGAAAISSLFMAARAWGAGAAAALFGVLPVCLATGFLFHATTVEVYTGLALLLSLLLMGLGKCLRERDERWALALSFLVGLSIAGHHPELRLFALPIMVLLVFRPGGSLRRTAQLGGAVTAGLAVIAYLPIRSSLEPWRNWGDPSTPSGLWDHFWGTRIRAAYGEQMGASVTEAMGDFFGQLSATAPALLVIGLVGVLLVSRIQGGWVISACLVFECIYSTVINPMGLRDWQNGIAMLCLLGLGSALFIQSVGSRRPRLALLVAVVLMTTSFRTKPDIDAWSDGRSRVLLNHIEDHSPPESLCLVASDNMAAGLAYRQVVEGGRPDLAVVVRQHVGYASSMGPVFRRLPHATAGWRPGATLADLESLKGLWPLGWEWTSGLDVGFRPTGLKNAFPLFSRGYESSTRFDEHIRELIKGAPMGSRPNPGRTHFANLSSDRGRERMSMGAHESAVSSFRLATEIEPLSPARWDNLGAALSRSGRLSMASEASAQALVLEPGFVPARINHARYAIALGEWMKAVDTLRPIIEAGGNAAAFGLRGVARGNLGDLAGAQRDFEAALKIDPSQPEALDGLRVIQGTKRNEAGQ